MINQATMAAAGTMRFQTVGFHSGPHIVSESHSGAVVGLVGSRVWGGLVQFSEYGAYSGSSMWRFMKQGALGAPRIPRIGCRRAIRVPSWFHSRGGGSFGAH